MMMQERKRKLGSKGGQDKEQNHGSWYPVGTRMIIPLYILAIQSLWVPMPGDCQNWWLKMRQFLFVYINFVCECRVIDRDQDQGDEH